MASETISPNMLLPIPGVSLTDGPQWATDLNNCLTLVDQHDHSSGSGVQITPNGININADLSHNNNNITAARSVRFFPQLSPLSLPADLGCLYESGVDLYYNDGAGNQVRITQSGGVAGTPGSIANLVPPASASYVSANGTFVWQQAANTSADMDFGSAIMRNDTASSFALTLSPPTLGGNYSLTLPTVPGSQKFMTLDNTGAMAAPWAVDNSTLEIASSTTLQVKAKGITATQIADSTITGTQVASNINLPGNAVQENGKNIVVSGGNAATSLAIVRGTVAFNGTILNGEGFSASKSSTGSYQITFSSAFASNPAVVATADSVITGLVATLSSLGTSTIQIATWNGASPTDSQFGFIAIGPR